MFNNGALFVRKSYKYNAVISKYISSSGSVGGGEGGRLPYEVKIWIHCVTFGSSCCTVVVFILLSYINLIILDPYANESNH